MRCRPPACIPPHRMQQREHQSLLASSRSSQDGRELVSFSIERVSKSMARHCIAAAVARYSSMTTVIECISHASKSGSLVSVSEAVDIGIGCVGRVVMQDGQ
jgi:hypothetical protein